MTDFVQKNRKGKASLDDFRYGESVSLATQLFLDVGNESPRLDAELLLAHVLKKNRLELHLARDEMHSEESFAHYFSLVARRLTHEPIAYIVGHKEFYGHEFVVSPACLIPRPDTEILVEECLALIDEKSDAHVLDLCTGSGAIVIALLKARNNLRGVATDISRDALDIATMNAKNLVVSERLKFMHGDLFAELVPQKSFALIASNPPYIKTAVVHTLSSTVKNFEPHLALDGDGDGLKFYRRILNDADKFLLDRGYLVLEIGFDQADELMALIDDRWMQPKIVKDLAQHDRVIVLQLRSGSGKP